MAVSLEPAMQLMVYFILLSTIAWCGVITLAVSAFRAKFKETDTYSPKMRLVLLIYVVVMTGISTASLIRDVIFANGLMLGSNYELIPPEFQQNDFTLLYEGPNPPVNIELSLAIFGADSLMIWRCYILYQGIRQSLRIFVKYMLICVWVFSLGFTGLTIATAGQTEFSIIQVFNLYGFLSISIDFTIILNLVLAILITIRIWSHEKQMRNILGAHRGASPFKKILAICIESCALMFFGAIIYCVVSILNGNVGEALSRFLTNICVISPLLLIVQVAKGRTHPTMLSTFPKDIESPGQGHSIQRGPIRFLAPTSQNDSEVSAERTI